MTRIRKILGSDAALWCLLLVCFLRTFNLGAYKTEVGTVAPADGVLNVLGRIETTNGVGINTEASNSNYLAIGDSASAPISAGDSDDVAISYDSTLQTIYYRDSSGDPVALSCRYMVFRKISQAAEPTLSVDGELVIWEDSDDSSRIYLVYRRGSGDQVKVELT